MLDGFSSDGKRIVFVSSSTINISAKWMTIETYDILDNNQIQEIIELAAPHKESETYTKVILARNK